VPDRSVLVPMALSDHEGGRKELNVSGRSLRNYAPTVKRRTTKFAMVTLVGEGHVSRELDTPAPPKLLAPLTDEARFLSTATKFGNERQVEDGYVSRVKPPTRPILRGRAKNFLEPFTCVI